MSSNPALVVRPMVTADLKLVLPFCERVHSQLTASRFDGIWKADWLRNFIANASSLSLVACKERPVGYLLAEIRREDYSKTWFLQIREIYVEEGSRLLGCGTALMNEARVQAERLHCAYLSVNVRQGNLSSSFFNGLGFSAFSTEYRTKT